MYKMTEKVKIGETAIKKGDHFYLDNLHKDHLEVFDRNGLFKDVVDFDEKRLLDKFNQARKQGRSIKDLVSDGIADSASSS